jgi:hypothetical protein
VAGQVSFHKLLVEPSLKMIEGRKGSQNYILRLSEVGLRASTAKTHMDSGSQQLDAVHLHHVNSRKHTSDKLTERWRR